MELAKRGCIDEELVKGDDSDGEETVDPASRIETRDPDDVEQASNPAIQGGEPEEEAPRRSERRREQQARRAASQSQSAAARPAPAVKNTSKKPKGRGRPRKVHHFRVKSSSERRVRFAPVLEERAFDILSPASDYGASKRKQIREYLNDHGRGRYYKALAFFPNINRPPVAQFMYYINLIRKRKRNKAL